MKIPRIKLTSRSVRLAQNEALILFAFAGKGVQLEPYAQKVVGAQQSKRLKNFFAKHHFTAGLREIVTVPGQQEQLMIVVGLGTPEKVGSEELRKAANAALTILEKIHTIDSTVVVPATQLSEPDAAMALTEGFLLGAYEFDRYSKTLQKKYALRSVSLAVSGLTAELRRVIGHTVAVSERVLFARDLENDTSDVVNPESFAQLALREARSVGLGARMLDEKALAKEGLNLICAVGRASVYKPRLVILEHRGASQEDECTVLVGKGVTFDSGGLNLKPSYGAQLEEMHLDMSGAAAVLSTVLLAAQLKIKKNIVGILPIVENAIAGNAYKPGSILTAYDGKTVQVLNTDAEGRLIVADAIAYAVKNYKPSRVIDIATLAGATIVALGYYYAPLLSNDDDLANALAASGQRVAEYLWRLPLDDDYRADIKGSVADVQNASRTERAGGAITAAAFIETFAGKIPWAHIDMAGTSWLSARRDYRSKGGTGFGVRLFIDYFLNNK